MASKSPLQASRSAPAHAPKRVEVALAVIVGRPRPPWRVLVARRPDEAVLGGFWEFPGGKREPGESLPACACREALEELAVHVRVLRPLTPIGHAYAHATIALHPFLAEHVAGEPKALEVSAWRWVGLDELAQLQFPPANGPLVAEIRRLAENGW